MIEKGKTIDGFSDYEIYEDGRIWSKKWNRFLKSTKIKNKYRILYMVDDNGVKKMVYLNKLKREIFGAKVPELKGAIHKVIEGFEDYSIYSNGIVYSHKRNIFLKPSFNNFKMYVTLSKDKVSHLVSVAKLVAKAFIPNYNEKGFLVFKDKDYGNCNLNNLEFRSEHHIKIKN